MLAAKFYSMYEDYIEGILEKQHYFVEFNLLLVWTHKKIKQIEF